MHKTLPKKIRIVLAAISFLLSISAFLVIDKILVEWLSLQLGPNIAKLFAAFSFSTLIIVAVTFILTFLFGRFYCAVFCPLGILQDIIGYFSPNKKKALSENYPWIRYTITAVVFIFLLFGFANFFALLDPYSNFGRIATGLINPIFIALQNWLMPNYTLSGASSSIGFIIFGALLPLIILIALVVWKKRIFCTAICPVGTLLGLASKKGFYRLDIDPQACVMCRRCTRECPAACITIAKEKTVDSERCVMCMNCAAVCPVSAFRYSHKGSQKINTDFSRRDFLKGGFFSLIAFGSTSLYKFKDKVFKAKEEKSFVVPPGAGSKERFFSKCTDCQLCLVDCKGKVLQQPNTVVPSVHLDFNKGACEFQCDHCFKVCPTGALKRMSLAEKQRLRIAIAELQLFHCITIVEEKDCAACVEVCPTGALYMTEYKEGIVRIPQFREEYCIGCGNCEYVCPAKPYKALVVHPIPIQVQADDPKELLENNSTTVDNIKKSDDWLL